MENTKNQIEQTKEPNSRMVLNMKGMVSMLEEKMIKVLVKKTKNLEQTEE